MLEAEIDRLNAALKGARDEIENLRGALFKLENDLESIPVY